MSETSQAGGGGWVHEGYEPRASTPAVGSTWIWEKDKPWARAPITVVAVLWNGQEWWVQALGKEGLFWNDLSRFWEACWPDPDPNTVAVGATLLWRGRPSFAKALPSGWQNCGSSHRWSLVGPHTWRRIA